jgi:2-oxoglutarate dehydrogenase E2 component (dihydrolipoamide succinyltransferase)
MATKVTMPQMGESIFEGTITKWLKKVGDTIARDEPLFEISTDKVDSEIPSPASGILSQILVPEGKTVQINTVLAIINGAGAEEKETAMTHTRDVAAAEIPEERTAAKSEGQPAPREPEKTEPAPPPPPAPEPPKPVEPYPGIRAQDIRTSPLVRRLARENNVDLSQIHGTGRVELSCTALLARGCRGPGCAAARTNAPREVPAGPISARHSGSGSAGTAAGGRSSST